MPNVSFQGNPFDLVAEVTFEHESGKETRTTGMFYAADGKHWKFRFTAGRPGTWTFRTRSDDPDLDGRRGTITISLNRGAHGFVTHKGNKWARPLAPWTQRSHTRRSTWAFSMRNRTESSCRTAAIGPSQSGGSQISAEMVGERFPRRIEVTPAIHTRVTAGLTRAGPAWQSSRVSGLVVAT